MIRSAAVVVCLVLVCIGQAAAQDDGFKWASVAFGAGVFADAWTTERALDFPVFQESNRMLPARPTDSRLIGHVLIFDGAVYLTAWKLRERHPVAARWILIGAALVHATAAVQNDRVFDDWKR